MLAMEQLLGVLPGDEVQQAEAKVIATMPVRLGGLGLRSADRMTHAAYWASWADALHVIAERFSTEARIWRGASRRCQQLQIGWTAKVSRGDLTEGVRPPIPVSQEPGGWEHGWQHHASSASEYHFRETVLFAKSCAADQFQLQPGIYRTLLLERLRLPLHITEARCECGARLDRAGRHRAACARSGRLKRRAMPTERTLARVCREAGAVVRTIVKLRDS